MQVFGNVASPPERKVSKNTQKGDYEFRLAESQKGVDTAPTWNTVRMMLDENPQLNKGDFARVTGKLKTDFYLSREGKPTGTLLIIAFEAGKISKNSGLQEGAESGAPVSPKETMQDKAPATQLVRPQAIEPVKPPICAPEPQKTAVAQEESDWSTLYSRQGNESNWSGSKNNNNLISKATLMRWLFSFYLLDIFYAYFKYVNYIDINYVDFPASVASVGFGNLTRPSQASMNALRLGKTSLF